MLGELHKAAAKRVERGVCSGEIQVRESIKLSDGLSERTRRIT